LVAAIGVLLALVSTRFSGFTAPSNLANVFNDTSPLILLAIGQMIVILTKCIDLSVAANLALTGMIVSMVNVAAPGLPVAVTILLALGVGTMLGMINGVFVWKLQIPSIVVTLGTLTIFRGWIAIIAVILMSIVMARTTLGRAFYAAGGNPRAATYAGVNVGKTQFWAFTISGALAGITGYLWVSRYAVAYVDIAGGFELDVVAACVMANGHLRRGHYHRRRPERTGQP